MTLEEQVLRVLYEAPASAAGCSAELQRSYGDSVDSAVRQTLAELANRSCVASKGDGSGRYVLTPAGSERLATLTETRERSRVVA